jgi:hypothetical protein
MQYVQVRELVNSFQLMEGDDTVAWRWCASGQFSSSSAYDVMFLRQSATQGAKQLWKVIAPPEDKFFLWLAIQDRTGADLGMASLMMQTVHCVCNTTRRSTICCSTVSTTVKFGS